MCQLLGMNCNVPTDICFSFTGFRARGGETSDHQDGWGIVFFEGTGVRQFLDPSPSHNSPIAEFVKNYPIKSKNVIAHIRKATIGDIRLENTHPFIREVWGQNWSFAHNGDLKEFHPKLEGKYQPIGSTDSERAFCLILEELTSKFGFKTAPKEEDLLNTLNQLVKKIRAFGTFNFLLSNGNWMIAHCSTKLCYIVRKAPFNQAKLKDSDLEVDFSKLTKENDRVLVIATEALTTNETWTNLASHELFFFKEGNLVCNLAD